MTAIEKELKYKDELIDILKNALNNNKSYCKNYVIFKNCSKQINCGDCIIEQFYRSKLDTY